MNDSETHQVKDEKEEMSENYFKSKGVVLETSDMTSVLETDFWRDDEDDEGIASDESGTNSDTVSVKKVKLCSSLNCAWFNTARYCFLRELITLFNCWAIID